VGRILHPTPVEASALDLSWLVGQQIESVFWSDPLLWLFSFSGGARLTVECPWRIIAAGHIAVSSEDHGQQYGLPAPIDAAAVAREQLAAGAVTDVRLSADTLDLLITLGGGATLQIIPFSRGYEAWQIASPGTRQVVAGGGGRISTYDE
jgi:hypothetical protein